MKRAALWTVGILLGIAASIGILQMAASERVEVVELHTTENGERMTTRLWVVDHEGLGYLRAGGGESGWSARALANETVDLTRGDRTASYRVETRPALRDLINDKMNAKYTWGDDLISVMVGSRDNALPIALIPLNTDD